MITRYKARSVGYHIA